LRNVRVQIFATCLGGVASEMALGTRLLAGFNFDASLDFNGRVGYPYKTLLAHPP
jgi:hypothetical protein